MLNEMLRLLDEGGIHSTAELAQRLGLSTELLVAITEDLASHGYLVALGANCSTSCNRCSWGSLCALPSGAAPKPSLLALTEKGRRKLGRSGPSVPPETIRRGNG